MKDKRSHTNKCFEYLSNSPDFLYSIISNLNACVLLLDKQMRLVAFNDPIKTIFSNKPDEHLLYHRCGEALGCAHTVDEMKDCGKTSKCESCKLRELALLTYLNDQPVYKEQISREFYTKTGEKEMKHLQFSIQLFRYEKEKYILILVEDITHLVNQKETIKQQQLTIDKLINLN